MPSAIRSRRSGIGKHQIVPFDLVRSGAAAQFIERLHVRRIVHWTQLGDEVGAEVLAKFLGEPRLLKSDVVAQKAEQIAGRRRHAAEIADSELIGQAIGDCPRYVIKVSTSSWLSAIIAASDLIARPMALDRMASTGLNVGRNDPVPTETTRRFSGPVRQFSP